MAMPRSVTRIKKDGVEFISNVDQAEYTIQELSRAALRDVGRLLNYRTKQNIHDVTGALKSNVGAWVRGRKGEPTPYLQIGVYNTETSIKKGKRPVFHAHFAEFGTKNTPATNNGRGYLRPAVLDNIEEIRSIQAQYLSYIEKQDKAKGLINEREEISDD